MYSVSNYSVAMNHNLLSRRDFILTELGGYSSRTCRSRRVVLPMNRDLISRGDLSYAKPSGCSRLTKVDANMRRAQASPLSILRNPLSCPRDNDCQRVSAANALTVYLIQARSALARPTLRSDLGLKNFWKPGPYQIDSAGVVIKPLSARLRT